MTNGAVASFVDTLPLLHPFGRLVCHDLFVTDVEQYHTGFRGPGKYDGSVVNWVNGPLLAHIGSPEGLRRAVRTVRAPQGHEHRHDDRAGEGLMTNAPGSPLLPTTVVGSYSVPEWLERLKTDFYQRRLSHAHLNEIHETAIKAALKDQERAGIDIVSDGELRRDNDVDYFLGRLPGVSWRQPSSRSTSTTSTAR